MVSLTSSLQVISLAVLADSIYNILIYFTEKMWKATHIFFFSKKFQRICVSLDVNFNESLTNDVVSFEHLGPDIKTLRLTKTWCEIIRGVYYGCMLVICLLYVRPFMLWISGLGLLMGKFHQFLTEVSTHHTTVVGYFLWFLAVLEFDSHCHLFFRCITI